ncbi:cob(I)yrinic acid a,c-diamide adenosyltransferase [Natranaerofaba carboxydovora]|uniref:cob(I)yrinic acid a,c-diamide adenosyltransferase n=1 Tax=Natranaerofaba carboxydovora TaxID=2742683 RepID=UPI001F13C7AE|nr:cob(I)yrinic acid a,c-diamide adenosyltransferase [Natranaerofaba carboxydovora]UMZ73214.1 Cob(I)yrinic acid a,c-diamide adenosyltransferase [Natranaerofaba carboxydovora]
MQGDKKLGTVQIYTGNGKGKTTAALGLCLRNLGHNHKVFVLQFMKGSERYGEFKMSKKLEGLEVKQIGRDEFVKREDPDPRDVELAREGYEIAKEKVQSGEYDLIVLDEIIIAVDFGLIELGELKELIKNKPKELELVLTGRYAHKDIIDMADLVTEVKDVKHHFDNGVEARQGVEY